MATVFPGQEWLDHLIQYINQDEKYAKTARKWEGDLVFDIQADGALEKPMKIYLDLWHGKCRSVVEEGEEMEAAFVLRAGFNNFVKVLKGEMDPMQAMMTRKLAVKGSMPYMMRNVPVVLEFVRCVQDATDDILGE
ncbi:SCP2 sterol-binding domain-containing protein [Chloroflexota bacterium]